MEPSSVKKKLKEKSFAAQVDRQDITDGLEAAGLTFEDLCAFVIRVQREVK
jgi:predicted hydrolase (HD superfamily)